LNKADPERRKQIWKEYAIISQAKGITSKSFREEVNRLRSQ